MNLILFPLLCTRSRRAIRRNIKGSYGKPYVYNPRGDLIENLANKTGMSKERVYEQLMRERRYLISNER